ncbi:hypothetical protein [Sporomusa sp. KB1]|jgi:hypothetical protein|uniref:hypothetical protein n=1 Tax=Sporomusa sp. KB1 TaxID=943346 RepID=UPI0011ADF279|nr:hypothetical protein [Sporomusa sp. KB1]TWH49036.1 hypothetical protein Salpa_5236 [Sporomusa sp. KB1]
MNYINLVIGAVIGFHALTYARWLKNNGNILGAIGIAILVLTGLALSLLHMFKEN